MPEQLHLSQRDNSSRKVYVVYGQNIAARDAMYEFLRALDLQPIEKDSAMALTEEGSPFIGRILDVAFEQARAVVVLLTGDDEAHLREELWEEGDDDNERELRFQPRQDQVFEAGYAFGKSPTRTILVQIGRVKLFSDIAGRYISNFTGKDADRNNLKNRLKNAGCDLNDMGSSWLRAGDFQKALK